MSRQIVDKADGRNHSGRAGQRSDCRGMLTARTGIIRSAIITARSPAKIAAVCGSARPVQAASIRRNEFDQIASAAAQMKVDPGPGRQSAHVYEGAESGLPANVIMLYVVKGNVVHHRRHWRDRR